MDSKFYINLFIDELEKLKPIKIDRRYNFDGHTYLKNLCEKYKSVSEISNDIDNISYSYFILKYWSTEEYAWMRYDDEEICRLIKFFFPEFPIDLAL